MSRNKGKAEISHDEKPQRSKFHSCLRAIYNPRKKTFCGRTGSSWAKIGLFYLIYYVGLACFFCGMLSVLVFGLMSSDMPYRTGQNSLLRVGPGVSVNPQFRDSKTKSVENTVLHVHIGQESYLYKRYQNFTEKFLAPYRNSTQNQRDCDLNNHTRPFPGVDKEVCRFPMELLGDCNDPLNVLKTTKTVCIFLKLNRIYGWLPDVEQDATTPMVECVGQNPADVDNLGEPIYAPNITYHGKTIGAISHAFFPYLKQEDYVSPLVAISFPKVQKNMVILLKCHVLGVGTTTGETTFELMVDDDGTSS